MPIIHHVVVGKGRPAVVFVHGFGCARSDWEAQMMHLSPRHLTVTVDLRGHGATPGTAAEFQSSDTALMWPKAYGRSRCPCRDGRSQRGVSGRRRGRLAGTSHRTGVVLIDGSQFGPATETVLKQTFTTPNGFEALVRRLFEEMFTGNNNAAVATSVPNVPSAYPGHSGTSRRSTSRATTSAASQPSLAELRVPVMGVQSTTATNSVSGGKLCYGVGMARRSSQTQPPLDAHEREMVRDGGWACR